VLILDYRPGRTRSTLPPPLKNMGDGVQREAGALP
jgi:hypothetical protein